MSTTRQGRRPWVDELRLDDEDLTVLVGWGQVLALLVVWFS